MVLSGPPELGVEAKNNSGPGTGENPSIPSIPSIGSLGSKNVLPEHKKRARSCFCVGSVCVEGVNEVEKTIFDHGEPIDGIDGIDGFDP